MKLSLVGIGAVLRSEDGYAKIISLVPGGPAESGKKLKPSDKVEAVAQGDGPFIEVVGMKLDRVVGMIRGEKGTTVRLRVIPADAIDPATRVVLAIVRDEIKLTDQEAKARVYTIPAKAKDGRASRSASWTCLRSTPTCAATTPSRGHRAADLGLRKRRWTRSSSICAATGTRWQAVSLTGLFIKDGPSCRSGRARHHPVLRDTSPTSPMRPSAGADLARLGLRGGVRGRPAGSQPRGPPRRQEHVRQGDVQSVLEPINTCRPRTAPTSPAPQTHGQSSTACRAARPEPRRDPGHSSSSAGDLSDARSTQKIACHEIDPPPTGAGPVDGEIPPLLKAPPTAWPPQEFEWIREDSRGGEAKKVKSVSLNSASPAPDRGARRRRKLRGALKAPFRLRGDHPGDARRQGRRRLRPRPPRPPAAKKMRPHDRARTLPTPSRGGAWPGPRHKLSGPSGGLPRGGRTSRTEAQALAQSTEIPLERGRRRG